MEKIEKEIDDLKKRYSNIEERLRIMETNNAKVGANIDNMKDSIDKINTKLDRLIEKPEKKWDLVVAGVIAAAVAFVMQTVLV